MQRTRILCSRALGIESRGRGWICEKLRRTLKARNNSTGGEPLVRIDWRNPNGSKVTQTMHHVKQRIRLKETPDQGGWRFDIAILNNRIWNHYLSNCHMFLFWDS